MPDLSKFIRLLTRSAVIAALALAPASVTFADFCAPPSPTPNDTPPQPDNPPSCGPRECERCNASPCFAKTGVYTTGVTDLQIPTNGFPLAVSRSYESSHVVDGALGYGWRSNLTARLYYATYLFTAPSTFSKEAIVVMPDGESYRFRQNTDGSFAPPTGRRDTLTKAADGTFTLVLEHSNVRYAFAADGSLQTIKDEYGNTLRFTRDGVGRVSRVDDDSGTGRYLIVTWNPAGRISSVEDNIGRTVSYAYGTDGTLTGITNPANQTTTYSYEQRRFVPLLKGIRDHWNRAITDITWDALDRVQTYTELGERYEMTYGTAGTGKKHSLGTQSITYDAAGLVTSRGAGVTTYTADGDVSTATDARNNQISYTYLSDGRVATVARTSDATFHYTYDPTYPQKVAKVVPRLPQDAARYNGHWLGWKYTYWGPTDPAPGALKQVERIAFQHDTNTVLTDNDPTVSTFAQYSYDAKGRVTRTWDRTEGETLYQYADAASKIYVTAPSNGSGLRITTYVYDDVGRTTSVTDPLGNVTVYEYDHLDRIMRMTLPKPSVGSVLNFVITFSYDHVGTNAALTYTHVTDPNGRVTKQGYDQFGQLVESTDAAANTTRYAYAYGLLSSITDANGNVTSYEYDSSRFLNKTTFPDGKTKTYTHFSDGTLQSETDRKGVQTTYTYDALGHLMSQSTVGGGSRTYSYLGEKLIQILDTYSGTTEYTLYTHDPKTFSVLSETQGRSPSYPSVPNRGKLEYTWFPAMDHLQKYKVIDGGSTNNWTTVEYGYHPDGSIRTMTSGQISGMFAFNYNGNGQQTVITFPNGQTRNFTHDNQGRLTRLTNMHGSTVLGWFDYAYDKDNVTGQYTVLGQRTKATADVPALSPLPTVTEYGYDVLYQLTSTKTTNTSTVTRSWAYDAIGNRLTQTVAGSATSYTYVKNGSNPSNSSRLATAGTQNVTHDSNGNTNAFGGVTYTWDVLDRLKSRNTGSTINFKYDAQNRRVGIDHQSTKYIYNGFDPVAIAYSNNAGYYLAYYLFGPGVDEPLARVDYLGETYYVVDGVGSVIVINDRDGVVKNKYAYGAWGEPTTVNEQVVQPFAYTGREFATLGSGLAEDQYYYRARYMKPAVGRFLSEDPVGLAGGINAYTYADNDPITFTDAFGLQATDPDCDREDPCESLVAQIQAVLRELRRLLRNEYRSRFRGYPGEYDGHLEQWKNRKRQLNKLLTRFNDKNCNPALLPQNIESWVSEQYPAPPEPFRDRYRRQVHRSLNDIGRQLSRGPRLPFLPLPPIPIPLPIR